MDWPQVNFKVGSALIGYLSEGYRTHVRNAMSGHFFSSELIEDLHAFCPILPFCMRSRRINTPHMPSYVCLWKEPVLQLGKQQRTNHSILGKFKKNINTMLILSYDLMQQKGSLVSWHCITVCTVQCTLTRHIWAQYKWWILPALWFMRTWNTPSPPPPPFPPPPWPSFDLVKWTL